MTEKPSYRPEPPSGRQWRDMPEVERLRVALRLLADAVEHHHGHIPSLRERNALDLAEAALKEAKS